MRRICLAVALACLHLGAQRTLLVPGQYPDLGSAVVAAADGDVIRIGPGVHQVGGVRIDKSLRIVGDGGMLVGSSLVLAVPAGKQCDIAGCILGSGFAGPFDPRFLLEIVVDQSRGRVAILDGGDGACFLRVWSSPQVLVSRCRIVCCTPLAAMPLTIHTGSTVVLDNCTVIGRPANYNSGATAVPAASISGSDVRCVDTVFSGSTASLSVSGQVLLPGTHSILATSSILRFTGPDCALPAGRTATAPALQVTGGTLVLEPWFQPSHALAQGAVLVRTTVPNVAATIGGSGQNVALQLQSPAGSLGMIAVGAAGDRMSLSAIGDLWIDPLLHHVVVAGVQHGNLGWTTAVPNVPALAATSLRWQGLAIDNGVPVLTDPGALLLH